MTQLDGLRLLETLSLNTRRYLKLPSKQMNVETAVDADLIN